MEWYILFLSYSLVWVGVLYRCELLLLKCFVIKGNYLIYLLFKLIIWLIKLNSFFNIFFECNSLCYL